MNGARVTVKLVIAEYDAAGEEINKCELTQTSGQPYVDVVTAVTRALSRTKRGS